jgi:hypothetical protein
MSNDLLQEQFFNNPNIPDCEKLGVISLLGCGSLDQQMDSTGRESSFVSMCPKAGGGTQFIAFTYGRPESLNKMSVKTILHSIGFNGTFIDEMFSSMGDKEVVDEVVKFFRVARNTDKSKEPKVYEMIEPRLKAASEKYRVTDPYLTEHPQILTNIMEISKNSFGASLDLDDSKKKQ